MNVTGIQAGVYSPQWSPPNPETGPESNPIQDNVTISFQGAEKSKQDSTRKPEIDELVMKPSPVTAEERLSQVISPEQMKDLLSMIVRSRFSASDKGSNTGHRFDQKG